MTLECGNCNFETNSVGILYDHYERDHDLKPIGMAFIERQDDGKSAIVRFEGNAWYRHVYKEKGIESEMALECPHCEEIFGTEFALGSHIETIHNFTPTTGTVYTAVTDGRPVLRVFSPNWKTSRPESRKDIPLCTGVLDYFPDALKAVARVSKAGNDKHNPGQPLHWAREKSSDHEDSLLRHLAERGTPDPDDGLPHSAHMAWRALAICQLEEEARKKNEA